MKAQNLANQNLHIQKWVAGVSVALLLVKFCAYYFTQSVAVLTDAMESIVNVIAGFIGLYSLYVAAKPRDKDHPYGHGKAEFLSAAAEGTMIIAAGVFILYKGIRQLVVPVPVEKVDLGIWLVSITALVNLVMGRICIRIGTRNNSLALVASGRHLQSDTISTIGIVAGLILLYFTGETWIDGAVAIVFGLFIVITGYRIVRHSIAGIMDEVDEQLLSDMVEMLNANRRINWIDLHNLRVIKYGSVLHVDCHLTVPWYLNVHEAHEEIDALSEQVRNKFGESVELFVHSDGCLPFQCPICDKEDCPVRQHPFERTITWTLENISQNQKHQLPDT
ncbi:MAG: cation transporter [Terrimonas ferruginea]|uniref:cation diffusion facilitator family transporter n=1 Tax=Terrimonas ferruginea TaxID=249 RepID=UPI00092AC0A8|nr:cation diffusion facilitator family transporter [Terrimonas ferruginea]MBN8781493.1 cation transporter [Terrimonas ferruginea]OJW44658.1 MAG: cation diffusion facilitator family transporter [Sphingobacteriales bacterium 48-107]